MGLKLGQRKTLSGINLEGTLGQPFKGGIGGFLCKKSLLEYWVGRKKGTGVAETNARVKTLIGNIVRTGEAGYTQQTT